MILSVLNTASVCVCVYVCMYVCVYNMIQYLNLQNKKEPSTLTDNWIILNRTLSLNNPALKYCKSYYVKVWPGGMW